MNEVFLIGKVIKKGEFKFIYGKQSTQKSKVPLEIETIQGEKIKCEGYDKIADQILRKKLNWVIIHGKLKTSGIVQIKEIKMWTTSEQ